MQWFAFDSMGEFAFNENFGMMKTKTWHRAIIQQRSALAILGSLNHTVWAIRLAFAFLARFWRVKDWMGMISFSDQCMERRLQTEATQPDIASHFIKEFHEGRNQQNWVTKKQLLSGNTVSVIVGGRYVYSKTLNCKNSCSLMTVTQPVRVSSCCGTLWLCIPSRLNAYTKKSRMLTLRILIHWQTCHVSMASSMRACDLFPPRSLWVHAQLPQRA